MRADAIPLRLVRSRAVLLPEAAARLFGSGYTLHGTERLELIRLGKPIAMIEVETGEPSALVLDAIDRAAVGTDRMHLRGPKGVIAAPPVCRIAATLVLPDGVRVAWNLSSTTTTVALGGLAVQAEVQAGTPLCLHIDRALALAAGVDETAQARWLPSVAWQMTPTASMANEPEPATTRRLITENDVRQARLHHKRLHIGPDQLVTPAARSLGRELGVFDDDVP